jgi:hypothetical protein
MASPLDYDPEFPHYWSEHPRDKVFGATDNAFSQFSGSSICHPIMIPSILWLLYLPSQHENAMFLAAEYAIYVSSFPCHAQSFAANNRVASS